MAKILGWIRSTFFAWMALLPFLANAQLPTGAPLSPQIQYEWLSPLPCLAKSYTPLPGQPALGLNAIKATCPDGTERIVSARVSVLSQGYALRVPGAGGQKVTEELLIPVPVLAQTPSQSPASLELLLNSELKRSLAPGAALRAQDLRPQKLWQTSETVKIVLSEGGIEGTTEGIALSEGRLGARATAKTGPQGRVITGIAGRRKDGSIALFPTP